MRQIPLGDLNPVRRMNDLHGFAVVQGERRPQDFVSPDNFVEAVFERLDVQNASEAIPDRHAVRRIPRDHLVHQPHLDLWERKRSGRC